MRTLEERKRLHWKQDYRRTYELGEKAIQSWNQAEDKMFYAITLSPDEATVHAKGIWYDFDARERFVHGLWTQCLHLLNRSIHNNYRRYPELQAQDFVSVEHYDRRIPDKLIKPHIHGTLAVPCSRLMQFETLFHEVGDCGFLLKPESVDTAIKSVYMERIPSHADLCYWTGYALKQQALKRSTNEH
jgi:hypothetical protein